MILEIGLTVIGAVVGALLSWPIAYWYFRRGIKEMPDWAKNTPDWAIPLIESLPDQPVSLDRLIELYHDALDRGDFSPDPVSGYIKCPSCGADQDKFKTLHSYDERRGNEYISRVCGVCGTSLWFDER